MGLELFVPLVLGVIVGVKAPFGLSNTIASSYKK
jgi:hypothetical protein